METKAGEQQCLEHDTLFPHVECLAFAHIGNSLGWQDRPTLFKLKARLAWSGY